MEMTLRSEIEKGIAGMGMNFSEFGEWSGINRGIFSAILNSNPPKPISLNQLERIGRALGREDGWMFEVYINECFYDGRPNRRRVEPFLLRCAALGRNECIEEVLSRLLEDLRQLDTIFDIAEALYASGSIKESVVFYRCIVQNEKYHQSERLAISHYRLFRAALGEDNEQNLRAAIEFEPFCEKLPDHHRLDGLMKLVNVYFSLDKYAEAEKYSIALNKFSSIIYKNQAERLGADSREPTLAGRYPLVVYYGYGLMCMQNIRIQQNDFEEAERYIQGYEDLSWFIGLDEEGLKEVEKFKFYALANRLNLELLIGNENILATCISFMKDNPNELLQFTFSILKSANTYKYDADILFEEFSGSIANYLTQQFHHDKSIISYNLYCGTCYQAALYFLERMDYEKMFDYILKGMEVVVKIVNKEMFMNNVSLFEEYRSQASEAHKIHYKKLVGGLSK
ncbi:DNA-binding protein [Saccharibacillus brassicae]|uniref:DNA-binding protein n=1 Tax=Saccharibacillus brassicae TaxID=2583377 RepID=A0A4Y6USC1_SACBS|nr:DNA-binding protein [Saccharibacillus brassicae]QDH19660.1 DNA-binding protein [Saccharibacillus brassicae]